MTTTGTKRGDEKLARLKQVYWKWHDSVLTHCTKHNTSFDQNEEPCWQCYNECTKEV